MAVPSNDFNYVGPTIFGPAPGTGSPALPSGFTFTQPGTPKVGALTASSQYTGASGQTPLVSGFPVLSQMIDYVLRAQNQQQTSRRADIQQSVDIARLMADLERVSPTRAAAMAASMGVKPNADFSFANLFGTGANFPLAGGNRVRGNIGGVPLSLPSALSGQELSFLNSNPNVARVVQDIADALGVPDLFSRSMAARIPGISSIFAGGF